MSLPALVVLGVKQGDRHVWRVSVTEDDGTTPVDLSGYSWEFSAAKARPGRGVFWVRSEADPQVDTTDEATGVIVVSLLPQDSRDFGKLESVQFELTGTAPATSGLGRLTFVDGSFGVRLEVADE